VLTLVILAGTASTGAHYTHNYLEIEHYPRSDLISNAVIQAGILVSWPLLTAVGLAGYRLYALRKYRAAQVCLALYSPLGLITLGHFLFGSPDIPAFWYATIFTDALTSLGVLAFAAWSVWDNRLRQERAAVSVEGGRG